MERSVRIHFLTAILVLLAALRLQVSRVEMVLLFLAITLIIISELINTCVESLIDAFVDKENATAKFAKDAAAGGVLIAVIGAMAVGYLVFFDKIRTFSPRFVEYVKVNPVHTTVVAFLIVMIFTIILKTFSRHGTPLRGGMPSGHAALAFATATVILWFVKNGLVISAAFLLALIVAHSRVETKAHGWLEVASGALLGFLTTLLIFQLFFHFR